MALLSQQRQMELALEGDLSLRTMHRYLRGAALRPETARALTEAAERLDITLPFEPVVAERSTDGISTLGRFTAERD